MRSWTCSTFAAGNQRNPPLDPGNRLKATRDLRRIPPGAERRAISRRRFEHVFGVAICLGIRDITRSLFGVAVDGYPLVEIIPGWGYVS